MRALLIVTITTQAACLATHGVSVDDRTGWVDEADVRRAVELVFVESYWTEASPALEIALVTTRTELGQACAGRTDVHGCYRSRYSTFGDPPDTITVLLPEYEVCLADAGYSVLVHELVHRWQHEHGWSSGHPVELFGEEDEGGHGGLTGRLECALAVDLCPWYVELSPRCQ